MYTIPVCLTDTFVYKDKHYYNISISLLVFVGCQLLQYECWLCSGTINMKQKGQVQLHDSEKEKAE